MPNESDQDYLNSGRGNLCLSSPDTAEPLRTTFEDCTDNSDVGKDSHCSTQFSDENSEDVSAQEAVLLLEQFCLRHQLSALAKNDLRRLISALFPGNQNLLNHSRNIEELIAKKVEVNNRFFCRICSHDLQGSNKRYCTSCNKLETKPDVYATISFKDQLTLKFQDEKFTESIKYKSQRESHADTVSDVYDGQRYKDLESAGYFLNGSNLTFQLCLDGCPIFKSSNTSAWPILLKINELPPHLRQKRENILVYGVWIGESKPDFHEVLSPLVSDFNVFNKHGVSIPSYSGEVEVRCRIHSLHVDLPAKATLLNMNQFNGAFSCSYCLHLGVTLPTAKGGHVKIFPFSATAVPTNRTDDNFREDAKMATKFSPKHGIKGVSALGGLDGFNLVEGVCIDYMHQVFLGITKRLMGLWFDSSNHSKPWYCGLKQNLVSERLCQITPPREVTRLPRALSSIKFWKASEYKNFLLYYLVPCMEGVLPTVYLEHAVLLSSATYLLSKQNVFATDMAMAETCLRDFVLVMETLYGPREMTLNVHMLHHIPWMVQLNGPLHLTSNFDFEDMIGSIKSAPSGTQSVYSQVVRKLLLRQVLPSAWRQTSHCGVTDHFFRDLSQEKERKRTVYGDMEILGTQKKLKKKDFKVLKQKAPTLLSSASVKNSRTFLRMRKGHTIYTSENYTRGQRRRDNVVTFMADDQLNHGIVQYYVSTPSQLLAAVTTLTQDLVQPIDGRIVKKRCLLKSFHFDSNCGAREPLMLIMASQLESKCIFFNLDNSCLLLELPSSSCFD